MFIVVDGSQVNGERTGFASDGAATRTYNLGTRPLTPDPERLCSEEPMMNGLQEVAAHTKEILNRSVHREKALRLRSRFKALHLALALPDWLVGGFSATVGVSVKPRCKPPGKERSGRREGYPSRPPTPPCVRFRTRRFKCSAADPGVESEGSGVPTPQASDCSRPHACAPYRRSRLVVMPVSSRHTRWATSQVGAAACHATRAAATSGRSCSDGRTVFFNGQAEGPHGAPDRRHTRGRGEGVLQLSQRAIRLRRNQRGQGV